MSCKDNLKVNSTIVSGAYLCANNNFIDEETGTITRFVQKLVSGSGIENTRNMFYNATNLKTIDLDISRSKNVSGLFSGCTGLVTVGTLKLSKELTSLSGLFSGCSSLTKIPNFEDTSMITNMSSMFSGCSSLKAVRNLNFTKMSSSSSYSKTGTIGMFSGCTSLTTLTLDPETYIQYPIELSLTNTAIKTDSSARTLFNSLPYCDPGAPCKISLPSGNSVTYSVKLIATNKGWKIT